METREKSDNEVIAEFMGVPKIFEHGKILWDTSRTSKSIYALEAKYLHYNTSWNWLMPVVENIHKIKGADVIIRQTSCEIYMFGKLISGNGQEGFIQSIYKTVVQFIKWYNEHGK